MINFDDFSSENKKKFIQNIAKIYDMRSRGDKFATVIIADIEAILTELPADHRKIFIYRYIKDYSIKQCQDIFQYSSGKISTLAGQAVTYIVNRL